MQLILKVTFYLLSALLEVLWFVFYPLVYIYCNIKQSRERLGIGYPQEGYNLLVHAASVGEVNGAKPLLLSILALYPTYRILLTVNTTTGRKAGSDIHPAIRCLLSPLDIPHLRKLQMQQTNPRLIIIVETEIWPWQLYAAKIKKIPVVFVNARISPKTINGYLKVKPLLDWLSTSIKLICTQSPKDTARFTQLFTKLSGTQSIITCGNLKYAAKLPEFDGGELRTKWGYLPSDRIVVMGSSRPGEETLLLNCFDALVAEVPHLKLIIAPRHMNRMDEIKILLKNRDVSYFSENEAARQIHIIDELGHLLPAYAMADIALIGGSYYKFGGHNPLEAAYYGKLIMMGEHHLSCLDSVRSLSEKQAIVLNTAETLQTDLRDALLHPEKYQDYGYRAKAVMTENNRSLDQHLAQLKGYLK